MNAVAVLIILYSGPFSQAGVSVTSVPFANMPACLEAKRQMEAVNEHDIYHRTISVCAWTGVKP